MNVLTKTLRIAAALLLGITSGCSRKAEQVAPATPEVLVTMVMPKDVPVLKEGVATLEGFITANINAQVQGYIISRAWLARLQPAKRAALATAIFRPPTISHQRA